MWGQVRFQNSKETRPRGPSSTGQSLSGSRGRPAGGTARHAEPSGVTGSQRSHHVPPHPSQKITAGVTPRTYGNSAIAPTGIRVPGDAAPLPKSPLPLGPSRPCLVQVLLCREVKHQRPDMTERVPGSRHQRLGGVGEVWGGAVGKPGGAGSQWRARREPGLPLLCDVRHNEF